MSATSRPARLVDCHAKARRSRNSAVKTGSSWTAKDVSAFTVTLMLVLLGTVFAANTNQPVFWLLLGPAPLAVGFTLITFLRERRSWRRSLPAILEPSYRGSRESSKLRNAGRNRSKAQRWAMTIPGF